MSEKKKTALASRVPAQPTGVGINDLMPPSEPIYSVPTQPPTQPTELPSSVYGIPSYAGTFLTWVGSDKEHAQFLADGNRPVIEYHRAAPASAQGKRRKPKARPWLYAIAEPNGHWQDGESCVFQDLESCQSDVDQYNENIEEGEPKYTVVPLYRHAQPASAAKPPEDGLEARLMEILYMDANREAQARNLAAFIRTYQAARE
jgi:hypothetical protein